MNLRTARDLGVLIRDERRRQGLDQKGLAQRVGVSRQWLIEMEKGKPGAAVGLVLRTLNALGLAVRVEGPGGARERAAFSGALVDIDAVIEQARRGKR